MNSCICTSATRRPMQERTPRPKGKQAKLSLTWCLPVSWSRIHLSGWNCAGFSKYSSFRPDVYREMTTSCWEMKKEWLVGVRVNLLLLQNTYSFGHSVAGQVEVVCQVPSEKGCNWVQSAAKIKFNEWNKDNIWRTYLSDSLITPFTKESCDKCFSSTGSPWVTSSISRNSWSCTCLCLDSR